MLYPVLHRLESLGYIEGRWEVSESGRRRSYYRITPDGRAHLVEEHRQWKAVVRRRCRSLVEARDEDLY